MEEGQNPGVPGNSLNDVPAGENPAGSITDIMDTMDQTTPEAKPEEKTGDKDEGVDQDQKKPEVPKWMEQLDKEALEDADLVKQLQKFTKIGDLAKSYSALEKKMGSSINIPSDEASAEEVDAFYRKLGKPESVEGYSITDPKAQPFKDIAFMNNLTDKQATGLFEGLAKIGAAAEKASAENLAKIAQESDRLLKTEWGSDYSKNLEYLKRGIAAYGGNALGAKLKASGLIYDADIVKMFANLGKQAAESTSTNKGSGGRSDYVPTSEGGMFNYKD